MKSNEIANKYGLSNADVYNFIKENATFPITENWWKDIITIPDYVDIATFIQPLLKEKDENVKKIVDEKQFNLDIQEQTSQQQELYQKLTEERYRLCIDELKSKNIDGYYEYKAISLQDIGGLFKSNSGRVNIEAMTQALNYLGLDGWHLVTVYSNELGKNALSGGVGGALLGVNSTVDENILIFERFVKI